MLEESIFKGLRHLRGKEQNMPNAFLLLEDLRDVLKTSSFPMLVLELGHQLNQMDTEHPRSRGGTTGVDGSGQEHGGKSQGGR